MNTPALTTRDPSTLLPDHYQTLVQQLAQRLDKSQIITDPLRLLAYGTDASFYRLTPKVVIQARSEEDVAITLKACHQLNIAVTFRAAGTSLSGQAISDSVLIKLSGWKQYEVVDSGKRIKLQPGVIGGHANRYLAAHGRKIGPDPASINAAMIGGIAANNASGMCCGTAQNSYNTLSSMRLILWDGTLLDTGSEASREAFKVSHTTLLNNLQQLAVETRNNQALSNKIKHKFRLKNTTGYSLNALIDFADPIDILQHLMIGSEGTLGFIAEVTYHTVIDHPHKATALILFDDIETTCQVVSQLKSQPVAAVELIDRTGLRAIEHKPGIPDYIKKLPDTAAALLVETRASDTASLTEQIHSIEQSLSAYTTVQPVTFTTNQAECDGLWKIRKGLFPAVGAIRETGTTVIIEDIAFPVERLAAGVKELQCLFDHYGYHDALIFGHALEGNLHFVFKQDFSTEHEVKRYSDLMTAVAQLVAVKYQGSLKAEHGTGRNMAPFVELEWGQEAYQLMQQIKRLFDPYTLLNPGVILNGDRDIHLKNLKPLPAVDALVDKCIECGFCEPLCPSRELTLTPRQRIVASREIARLSRLQDPSPENLSRLAHFTEAYQYDGDDTCAACGLCETACPVGINTGDLTRQHRNQLGEKYQKQANGAVKHFGKIVKGTRFSLASADLFHAAIGTRSMTRLTSKFSALSKGKIPQWHPYLPRAAKPVNSTRTPIPTTELKPVVYLPSCAARTMAPARGDAEQRPLHQVMESILSKAGYYPIYPEQLDSLCCGLPFQSKGLFEQAEQKSMELEQQLLAASLQGSIPIIYDTSPCTLRSRQQMSSKLKLYDAVDFVHDHLLDRLSFTPTSETVAVHATCSSTRLGNNDKLIQLAQRCVENLVIPDQVTCCGFAGDRGFTHPELNASALKTLKQSIPQHCQEGVSTSRSCEIGLSLHSGIHYHSILYLVDRCTNH